jgi:hypothetical protein
MVVVLVFESVMHIRHHGIVIPTVIVHGGPTMFVRAIQTMLIPMETVQLWGKFGAGFNQLIFVWYADMKQL